MLKKKKIIISFFVFLFVCAIFAVIFYIFGQNASNVLDFVDMYLKSTDPQKFANFPILTPIKVTKYFETNCKIIIQKDNEKPKEIPVSQYLQGLSKMNYTQMVQRCIVVPPRVINEVHDSTSVALVEGYVEDGRIEVADTILVIKKSIDRYRIKEILQTFREPSQNELKKITKASAPASNYNPKKGLGARYLGGGHFSANVSIAPDGSKLVYASLRHNSSELYVMNTDGTGEHRLTDTPYWEILPYFMPDGNNILFFCDNESYEGEPYLLNLSTGEIKRFAKEYRNVKDIVFFNGQRAVFSAVSNKGRDFYLMDTAKENIRQLTDNGFEKFSPVFSSNENSFYFSQQWYEHSKNPPRTIELFFISVDGNDIKQLTNDREKKHVIGCTSDKRLFYIFQNENYNNELWVLNGNDLTKKQIITAVHGLENAVLIPDESSIIFVDDRSEWFKYDVYSVSTKEPYVVKQITNVKCYCSEPSISKDGKFIALIAETADSPKNGKGKIMLINTINGSSQFLGNNY